MPTISVEQLQRRLEHVSELEQRSVDWQPRERRSGSYGSGGGPGSLRSSGGVLPVAVAGYGGRRDRNDVQHNDTVSSGPAPT